MDIVQHAFAFSDIEVLKAYIDCFDPGMWLSWSTRTADSERSKNMKEVANLLENLMFIGGLIKFTEDCTRNIWK